MAAAVQLCWVPISVFERQSSADGGKRKIAFFVPSINTTELTICPLALSLWMWSVFWWKDFVKLFCKKQEGGNVLGERTLVVDIGSFSPQKKEDVSLPQYSASKESFWKSYIHTYIHGLWIENICFCNVEVWQWYQHPIMIVRHKTRVADQFTQLKSVFQRRPAISNTTVNVSFWASLVFSHLSLTRCYHSANCCQVDNTSHFCCECLFCQHNALQ